MFAPIVLYAETHYRFKYFFSVYRRSEPEIIADGPHRLEPDAAYPVMVLIKDAHRFPVELLRVKVKLYRDAKMLHAHTFEFSPALKITSRLWYKIFDIHFSGQLSSAFGMMTMAVEIETVRNGKTSVTVTNNHPFTSKPPLKFYRSKHPLPRMNGWVYGDAHTHSTYTEDQVEFGSPVSAGPHLCRAMGLSFFAVTDHSYDLDDRVDNYLLNDPLLPKWEMFHREVDEVNGREQNFAVLRGEEVTCTNANGNNVHFLLFGNRRFFHGSGDGGEKWFRTKSEFTIQQILDQKERQSAAYASHPTEEVPFLQRLLLRRDEWTVADMTEKKLTGVQIFNGERTDALYRGLDLWKWMLRRGEKKFLLAGNDAHGNFNRFVQISIPMLSFREKETQIFGRMKTAVLTHAVTEPAILAALASGRSVVTNGPLLTIEIETDLPDVGKIGETVRGARFVVKLHAGSTEEFGRFTSIKVYHGIIGKGEQRLYEIKQFHQPFSVHQISEWHDTGSFSYIRAEAVTHLGQGMDREGFCYTNPIWITPT